MGSAASRRSRARASIGKTPLLRPGEMFEYTSGTPLSTPSGIMGGTYQMVDEAGVKFDIEIPTFSLDTPDHAAQPQLSATRIKENNHEQDGEAEREFCRSRPACPVRRARRPRRPCAR